MGMGPSRPEPDCYQELLDGLGASYAEAARLIAEADVFLLCTGAGFSADSGLAVYADVAKVSAYAQRGLEYHDICQPRWLWREPDLFWGFWGQCYNDYRDTPPHEGYAVIDRWAERLRSGPTAEGIRRRLAELQAEAPARPHEPYSVEGHAGGFFVFTSNVDAHHFDWFRACEIRECHGNTELYQCASGEDEEKEPCKRVWRAPTSFRFEVDTTSMLAPGPFSRSAAPAGEGPDSGGRAGGGFGGLARKLLASAGAAEPGTAEREDEAEAGAAKEADESKGEGAPELVPRIGHVRGGGRTTTLRHMPGSAPDAAAAGFETNHPVCPSCGERARPAILMFDDLSWRDVKSQAARWKNWQKAVKEQIEAVAEQEDAPPLKVVILEIGAGGNVPTVRGTAERSLLMYKKAGADARLIRVNPDFPLGDFSPLQPQGEHGDCVVSVMARGLESIMRIDAAMSVNG